MIRLRKGPEPEILRRNRDRWTRELLAEVAAGGDAVERRTAKYRQAEIKDAIKDETYRKCAYCESKALSVTFGDIEHIVPRDEDPSLTFEWDNLTLACDICNNGKSNRIGMLDPYRCDPEQEFDYFGPSLWHKPGRVSAELTRIHLKLNRGDLLESRHERIAGVANRLERAAQVKDVGERELLLAAMLEEEAAAQGEYAACVRAFLKSRA